MSMRGARSFLVLLLVLLLLPAFLMIACGDDGSVDVVPVDDAEELIENDESYAP